MRDSVAQACRTALSGDENARKCHPSVPYFTLGRRKVWVSLPRSPIHPYVILPCAFRQRKSTEVSPRRVVPHSWATKMRGSVTQAYRILLLGDEKYGFRCRRVPFILTSFCLAPFGNENGLKCLLKVSYCTLGRRKCAKVLPKRAALHPRATKSAGFVAEESHSSLRHSVLHLWASIMDRSVTQACRAALLGDENVRKCCLSVPRYTLGRRKCSEVSPKRAVLYPRATNSMGFVAEESHSSGTRRGTAPLGCVVERHRGFYLMWLYWLYHVEGGEEAAVGGGFLFQGEGIGSGGGWHTVEAHRAAFEMKF